MPLILQGATSGQATLQATDAQTVTITMPATSGTLVTTGGAQTIEFADGSASAPSITNSGDTNTGMFFPAADTIAFSEGGTEAMRLDASGNVLIGTTASTALSTGQLQIGTTSAADSAIQMLTSTTGTSGIYFGDGTTGDTRYRGAVEYANNGDSLRFYSTSAERMRIDSNGNLGLGVTPQTWYLNSSVYGAFQFGAGALFYGRTTSSSVNLELSTNSYLDSSAAYRYLFTGEASRYNQASGAHIWSSAASGTAGNTFSYTERMRIDSSGNLFVGRTSNLGTSRFVVEADSATTNPMTVSNSRSTAATEYSILFYRSGSIVGSVQTSLSATSYVTSSDYRLKENIAPMTGALDKVAQLKPVTYNWKSDGSDGQGFIAHELAEVVPDCVTGTKDGMRTEQYEVSPAIPATFDEEGNELTPAVEAVMGEREVPDYQGIDTSFLVATLTAAIQELKATVDAQAARIAALEGVK